MGGTTTNGYPYPVGTDRVMDGDNAIQAFAEAVNTRLRATAAGQHTTIGVTTNTVTLPAGRFVSPPAVQTTVSTATALYLLSSAINITTTSFQVSALHRDTGAAAAGILISWTATEGG